MLTEPIERTKGTVAVRYKYQRLRERLRQAIRTGDLVGKLPGERELARRYDANAKTINKALSDLTTEGLLMRHVGRGTFVANGDRHDAATWRRARVFGWIGPDDPGRASSETAFRQAEKIVTSKGHSLVRLAPAVEPQAEIADGALCAGDLRDLAGLVLASVRPSAAFLADLLRRHLPVVMVNNCHAQVKTAAVLPDYAQGTFELCEYLIYLGHRSIELVIGQHLLPAGGQVGHAYRAAMQRHGLSPRSVAYAGDAFDWRSLMDGADQPTALVCIGAAAAVQAARQAADAGGPAALSVAAMPEPGDGRAAEASITAYEVDPVRIVHWAMDLLLSAAPGEQPRTAVVPGQLVIRGSAAARSPGTCHECHAPEAAVV